MLIRLTNEDRTHTYWEIDTSSKTFATTEAWRAYRGLSYKDDEIPPQWADPVLITPHKVIPV